MRNHRIIYLLILTALISCGKDFVLTDPQTGQEPVPLASNTNQICEISEIKQINGNVDYSKLNFNRDNNNLTLSLNYFDFITNKTVYNIQLQNSGDTVRVDAYNWFVKDRTTHNVIKYFSIDTVGNTIGDAITYVYRYDTNNLLVSKQTFYNQTSIPDFTTNYTYSNGNLIACSLFAKDGKTKLLESSYSYDLTIKIKPWVYLFSDAFENNTVLQALPFGARSVNPITQINTKIFDFSSAAILDEWKTSFSGYVFSKDGYVLQVNCNGDNQQGLSLFVGTNRFSYSCK